MKPKFNWNGKTVLIVEDDDSSFLYVAELIRSFNCKTLRSKSGLDSFFQSMTVPIPDLIIMDIKLPELSGYDAIRLIKKYQPEIPIIALTACAMIEQKRQCYDAGCDVYLTKPILPMDLLININQFMGETIPENEYSMAVKQH
jgi:CheY-like chemotaxis protein